MTDLEFDELVDLIQAHLVFARLTEGRQYDKPFMDQQRAELQVKIDMARAVLVDDQKKVAPRAT
jgi:hypothetical protein